MRKSNQSREVVNGESALGRRRRRRGASVRFTRDGPARTLSRRPGSESSVLTRLESRTPPSPRGVSGGGLRWAARVLDARRRTLRDAADPLTVGGGGRLAHSLRHVFRSGG